MPLLLAAVAFSGGGVPRAALLGAVAGYAAFLPLLTWIIAPAGFVAWVLLASIMAAWYAVAAAVTSRWVGGPWIAVVAPAAWTGMEAWRNRVPLGGFGWASLGDAQVHTVLLPAARVVGGVGLTFVTALIGTLVFVAVRDRRRPRLAAFWGVAAVAMAAAASLASPAPPPSSGELDVLAVQGNDMEDADFTSSRERHLAITQRMVDETRAAVEDGGQPELTIWPESAVDRDPYGGGSYLLPLVEETYDLLEGSLLYGAILDGPSEGTFRNSLVLVDEDDEPTDTYAKRRYVPFGEYVPWRAVLGHLPPLRQVPRDGVPGEGPQTLTVGGVAVAPLICFETLFPDLVRANVVAGDAGLIVAATNDASFGRSAESAQHIAQSRLRAVESGRWVVHAALSGSSALVDPYGRVHARTGHFERDTIRARVPVAAGTTPFLSLGGALELLALAGGVVALVARVVLAARRPGR